MKKIHQKLTLAQWQKNSLAEQMGNIGSEISRAISCKKRNDWENEQKAVERALELLDLTVIGKQKPSRLKELLRLREIFCDLFVRSHIYHISSEALNNYFLPFALIARKF